MVVLVQTVKALMILKKLIDFKNLLDKDFSGLAILILKKINNFFLKISDLLWSDPVENDDVINIFNF